MKLTKAEISQDKIERDRSSVCYSCPERTDKYRCRAYCWNYAKWRKRKEEQEGKANDKFR